MLIYRVRIGYDDFDFTDSTQAIVFAETAMKKYVPTKSDDEIQVTITIFSKEVDNA